MQLLRSGFVYAILLAALQSAPTASAELQSQKPATKTELRRRPTAFVQADERVSYQAAVSFRSQQSTSSKSSEKNQAAASQTVTSELRSELAAAVREQKNLRARLAKVNRYARAGVTKLRHRLHAAVMSARRAESKLRQQVREASTKMEVAEKTATGLRDRLAATEKDAHVQHAAAVRAKAELQALKHAQELLHHQFQEATNKEEHDRSALAANEKEGGKLKAELNNLTRAASELRGNLSNEQSRYLRLKADESWASEQARAAQEAAEQDRMRLLKQIVKLQNSTNKTQHHAEMTEQAAHKAEEAAAARVESLKATLQKHDAEHNEAISKLQDEAHAAQQSLTNAMHHLLNTRKAAESLNDTVKMEAEKLKAVTSEKGKLATAHAAALKAFESLKEQELQSEKRIEEVSKVANTSKAQFAHEKVLFLQLQENLTFTSAMAEKALKAAHRDRMGLLQQIAQLQEDLEHANAKEAEAESSARRAQKASQQAYEQGLAEQRELQVREKHYSAKIESLQASLREAEADLSASRSNMSVSQQHLGKLRDEVERRTQQLQLALNENNDLRAARDAATKGETAFQQMDAKAEMSLKVEEQQLSSTSSELQSAQAESKQYAKEASEASAERAGLEKQLKMLRMSSSKREAAVRKQLHETMLTAADKIRQLQDQQDRLTAELKQEKEELAGASKESSEAKDTLLQETNAALKASQRADQLSSDLASVQKSAQESSSKAAGLSQMVATLRAERDRAMEEMNARAQESLQWRSKALTFEAAAANASEVAKRSRAENVALRQQATELSADAQRADAFEAEASSLKVAAKQNASRIATLSTQMERLRYLKESYSSEYEAARNDSDTWKTKASELDAKIHTMGHELLEITRQRDDATDRVRNARSQEDEYFEENARLTQQNEALNEKLQKTGTSLNNTIDEERTLKMQVDELRVEKAKSQQSARAAFVRDERELDQSRRDLTEAKQLANSLQVEMARTQAVLTDEQRHDLGLPTSAPAKAAPVVAVVHLAEKHRVAAEKHTVAKPVAHVTPQLRHRKVRAKTTHKEPRTPQRHQEAAFASTNVEPGADGASQSTLQRLAEYFATSQKR